MRALVKFLDLITGTTGAFVAWLVIPLIGASCYEVFSRYVLDAPTLWAFEVGYMFMGTHFLIGLAYTLREGAHVRVDIFYARMSRKKQVLIDAFTYLALVLPFSVWLTAGLWQKVLLAYASHERSGMSAFNPVIWPFRAVLCTAFALLALQALAQLIRCYLILAERAPADGKR
ncbi:MAG: TRAP transporter small permease subunit [Betaproteobacteria bacterium]|jgi:TRAP-type mannitol/chloroaromatic compound transport system permease small subunit|nr:TRAP transporter small permease subunit [Betaproteobacteria bacterium]